MHRGVKLILLTTVFLSFLALSSNLTTLHTQSVSLNQPNLLAHTNVQIDVIVDQAEYTDYDDDGLQDDVVTSFRVLISDGDDYIINDDSGVNYVINIQTELILPTGEKNTFDFQITTPNGVGITLGWINHATESGWYVFTVKAECINVVIGYDEDTIVFDPPGIPNDEPEIDMTIKQL